MNKLNKITDKQLDNITGGAFGYMGQWMTVKNITNGYLAIRTAPSYRYENEINHIGLFNGEQVQIAGQSVRGTGINNTPAVYAYVYAPKF